MDNSCIDGDEIILGYIPTWYALLSLVIGIYGYVHALKMTNISVSIILIVVTIIAATFFLSKAMEPDWVVLYSDLNEVNALTIVENMKKNILLILFMID